MGSRKSIPARSAISASFLLSGQLPDQRSGTSVTARPEEQLAPNKPICSLLPPCIARRAFNDGEGACAAHLSKNLPPVIAEKFSSRIPVLGLPFKAIDLAPECQSIVTLREEMMKKPCCVLSVALYVTALAVSPAWAAETVKIGVVYPLTGNAASAGQSAKDAINLGVEIVNTAHPDLKALPLGATAGLPNLGGAKIELDEADHQGNPQVGQQQTLRLITQDHVVAMLGSYHSSVSLVATAVAERQGIPYLVADSVAL